MFPTFPSFEFPCFGKCDFKINGKSIDEYFNDVFDSYKSVMLTETKEKVSEQVDDIKKKNVEKTKTKDMNEEKISYAHAHSVTGINVEKNDAYALNYIKTKLKDFYEQSAKNAKTAVYLFFFEDLTLGFVYNSNTKKFEGYRCENVIDDDGSGLPDYDAVEPQLPAPGTENYVLCYDPVNDFLSDEDGSEIVSEKESKEQDTENIKEKKEASSDNNNEKEVSEEESLDFQKMYSDVFDALYKAIEPYTESLKKAEKEGKSIVKEFYDEFWNVLGGNKTDEDDKAIDDNYEDDKEIEPEPTDSSEETETKKQLTIAEQFCEKYKKHFEKIDDAEEIDEDEYASYLADVIEEHIQAILDDEEDAELTYSKDRKDVYISFYLDDIEILQHDMEMSDISLSNIPPIVYSKVVDLLKEHCGFINVWFYNDRNDKDELTEEVICKCQIQ